MAEPNEPKKEAVRITFPERPRHDIVPLTGLPVARAVPPVRSPLTPASGASSIPRPPQARSPLPSVPAAPIATPPSAALARPLPPAAVPRPPGATPPPVIPMAPEIPATASDPKKETSRIKIFPDPPKPSVPVQMRKTQPLITVTARPVAPPPAPVKLVPVAAAEPRPSISLPLCWGILVVSAITLLIEIWTYIS